MQEWLQTKQLLLTWLMFLLMKITGQGLGKWLVEMILAHPDLQGLRRILLATKDAHSLYAQFGFVPFATPERWMAYSPQQK